VNRCLPVAALLLATSLTAVAQSPDQIAGRYSHYEENGPMLYVGLTHLEGDTYKADISTIVPAFRGRPGCGGGVAGDVTISGPTAMLSVPNPAGAASTAAKACKVDLVFDGAGKIQVTERDGCAGRHAPACGFSGTVTRAAGDSKP